MSVWESIHTIFKQRRVLQVAGLVTLCVAFDTTLLFNVVSHAAPGINQTISFSGRLLKSTGAVVEDGYYNMQFKIYQDGDGTQAGNPSGTLKWTETRINNGGTNGVYVKNGYFSVNLGSVNPFGTSVDWNQDTLWLSMNVAGKDTGCTTFDSEPCEADGEMLPMKRLTSTPYALNSGQLGGKTADQFVQLGQGIQTVNSGTSSIFINQTGAGSLLQLQGLGADRFTVDNSGSLILGSNADKTITVANADTDMNGKSLSILAGNGNGNGTNGGSLILSGGMGGGLNGNGGDIILSGGAGTDGGKNGLVVLGASSLSTTDDANCYTDGEPVAESCTISTTSLDSASAILVGFSTTGQTATLPDLDTTIAGRVIYIVASDDTEDFTLEINGGGSAKNRIAMSQSTTATLLWNGKAWAPSGTMSSSMLKDEYDSENDIQNVQITSNPDSQNPTLLTLDKAASAPDIEGNDALLGSMYYDTTLGKLQCYEADGWGACGSAPDVFVNLSPEYTNAVMNGGDTGAMSSGICSDHLDINDGTSGQPTICGANETFNFYQWTSSEETEQTRSIFVTYQLPSSFKEFAEGLTSIMARTDSNNAKVEYQIYRDSEDGLTACGSAITASTGTKTTWQKAVAENTSDPHKCGFEAGDSILIRINLTASNDANAYVSTIAFTYSNQ